MNLAGAFVLLLLAFGSIVSIFAAGASQPQTPYVDSFGGTTSAQGNSTQTMIRDTAPPVIGGLGVGILLIFVTVILFLAAIIVWKPTARYYGHR